MDANLKNLKTIDEYIALWPAKEQKILEKIRQCIRKSAPNAEEVISYQMPTFRQDGILLHFAVFTNHYSLFPGPEAIEFFSSELKGFETSKGTIKIPMETPVPTDLISNIVLHRLSKNIEKLELKRKSKKK